MRGVTRLPAAVAAALLVASLAGCGGSSDQASGSASGSGSPGSSPSASAEESSAGSQLQGAADLSTCRKDARPASTPYGTGFPRDWPFPSDAVVFHVEDRGADGTIVTAVTSQPFKDVLHFMNTDVVTAGFARDTGETEEHDAEAEWEGNGFHGRWAIQQSADCRGDTVIQVLSGRE